MEHLASRHQCHVYAGSPSQHFAAIGTLLGQKLSENYRCLYLNSPAMVAGMRSRLAATGVDVMQEIAKASLVFSSSQEHLVDGYFEPDRMLFKLEEALQRALSDGYKGLWAAGDMTWEVGFQSSLEKLLEYEWSLEECFRAHPELSGVCLYHADTLPREALRSGVLSHSSLLINETLSRMNPHYVQTESPMAATASPQLDDFIDQLCHPSEGD